MKIICIFINTNMWRNNLFPALALIVILCLGGCRSKADNGMYVDLAASVKSGNVRQFDLTQLGSFEHRLSVDEETQPFIFYSFVGLDERSVIILDWETVARVSLEDGSILARYARRGRGPLEYTRVRSCRYLEDTVYVRSNEKIIACTLDGQGIREMPVRATDNITILPGGHFFRFNATSFEEDVHLFDVLDETGTVLRESAIIAPTVGETAIAHLNGARFYDGAWYVQPAFTDQIWRISETEDEPWITINYGPYRMPSEYLSSLEAMDAFADSYITSETWHLIGKYFFFRYYRGEYHFCVFDLESGKLVFHSKSEKRDDAGIPFAYQGQKVLLWPVFSDQYHIIFRGDAPDDLWLFSRK